MFSDVVKTDFCLFYCQIDLWELNPLYTCQLAPPPLCQKHPAAFRQVTPPPRVVTPPFSNTTCTRVHLICPPQDNLCSPALCPVDLCTSSGSTEEEITRMFVVSGSGDGEESVSLLQCQQLSDELTQVARRAVRLHQQVNFLSD